jgi:CubicO group peptidase (beta-lactamase class C family)
MNLRSFVVAVALAGILATPPAGAKSTWPLPSATPSVTGFSADRLELMHGRFRQAVDAGKYSGYVILLARDGKIADWRAYGWRNLETKQPMEPDSIVRIYSMTKLVTSVSVLMLMEQGVLKLDDPVEKFLPALKDRKVFTGGTADAPTLVDAARPVTLRDLLTHTSGYYYGASYSADRPLLELFQRAKPFGAADLDQFVARVATLPLHQQPGERFRYGISTDLLGAVVEQASGQKLDVFFQERIFAPLKMRDTGFFVPEEKKRRRASIYMRDEAGRLVADKHGDDPAMGAKPRLFSGGGGLYSTAPDYVRFAQMLLNGGQLDGVRILSRKTVELMTQNHLAGLSDPHPFSTKSQGYGLGVSVVTDLGRSVMLGSVGAFGWSGAASTTVQIDPKERLVAILLMQHMPMNPDDVFGTFTNACYSALAD